jgi:hypothetical protein
MDVLKVTTGDFSVRMHMKCRRDGFEWNFVPVYGAAQDAQKLDFLSELVRMCDNQDLPMMVGGDFNIIRKKEEKIMIILMQDGLLCLTRLFNLST